MAKYSVCQKFYLPLFDDLSNLRSVHSKVRHYPGFILHFSSTSCYVLALRMMWMQFHLCVSYVRTAVSNMLVIRLKLSGKYVYHLV